MTTTRRLVLILACLLLAPATGYPENPATPHTPAPTSRLHLSPALSDLLRQEMNAILQGMQALMPAIVTGNWEAVADIGDRIQHSYIMQQQLTDAQKAELHQALPPGFVELDQSFHHSAGMLAHAAEMHNAEVVNFYLYKLTDTCVACHGKFAGYRFPGLVDAPENTEHKH
jgi:hypothetical protein